MTTEDTLKQFREMLYKYNSIPVTHRFGIEKKMIDKLESFLRDALDQARQEERAYIGKQKREWYQRGYIEAQQEIREKGKAWCLVDEANQYPDCNCNTCYLLKKVTASLPLKKEEVQSCHCGCDCGQECGIKGH